MQEMEKYARQYQHEHRNKGVVSNITPYCFTFTEFKKNKNDNNEKEKSYIVMKSYFVNLNCN